MKDERIVTWMKKRIDKRGFTDAASMAREFRDENNITNTFDPDFSKTMGFFLSISKMSLNCLK